MAAGATRAAGQAIDMLRGTLLPNEDGELTIGQLVFCVVLRPAVACTIECRYLDKSARNYKTP